MGSRARRRKREREQRELIERANYLVGLPYSPSLNIVDEEYREKAQHQTNFSCFGCFFEQEKREKNELDWEILSHSKSCKEIKTLDVDPYASTWKKGGHTFFEHPSQEKITSQLENVKNHRIGKTLTVEAYCSSVESYKIEQK